MHYPPKLVPPIFLSLALWVLLLPRFISSLPTVPSSLQVNRIHNLEKSFLNRPALEETIHEVQRILNQDPSLPRLTRGEIEELYEKVTREEYEKSIKAGDKVRADSMRALMLVLPFNTDNNTEENLQALFTRQPVTKVVDTYSSHQPIQFLTPSMNGDGKLNTNSVGKMDATTYKPLFPLKTKTIPLNPTTYHPSNPPSMFYRMPSTVNEPSFLPFKPIMTDLPQSFDYNARPGQRFSSHYSAKNAEFLKVGAEKKKTYAEASSIKPVADVLQSLGIVANTQTRSRIGLEDYYAAESAPKPSIVSVADLKGVRSQSLGPQIKPDAYSMFKPLNIGEEIRAKPEVEDYLARFGIVGGRKRKAIKKNEAASSTQNSLEPLSLESEIAIAKVPSNHIKNKKGAANSELEKLLENLKELERLNVNAQPVAAPTPRTTTTTTTTTTPAPTTLATSLITNGEPMLVQPKKPRRRIDPNIDINYANQGNHQTEPKQNDELSKLLENLQELEKLKINPERVLQPTASINHAASRNIAVETPAPVQAAALANRFATSQVLTPQQQLLLFQRQAQSGNTTPDLDQLQKVLQQLQAYEKNNARTSSTTPTTTTKRPVNPQSQVGPTDFWQLRKLLTDDSELEKLFEQAKARQTVKPRPVPITTTAAPITTTKNPTTNVAELLQLQRYLAQLEKATSRATTTPRTTTSTTTTTTSTTTTTTPKPLPVTQFLANEYVEGPQKLTMETRELQALIDRVQQLERLNLQHKTAEKPHPTDEPLTPLLGFTTRNVKAPSQRQEDYRLPVNDFANLRTLYRQVEDAEKVAQGEIEISTKATAVKAYQEQELETATRKAQSFAQRIIDITNDTGSGSSLQEVDPNDFVHLQKLLSKVQELERVRINVPTANPRHNYHQQTTKAPNLDMAASQRTQNIQQLNGAYLVYPTKVNNDYKPANEDPDTDLKLDVPIFKKPTEKPASRVTETNDYTSSEELKDLVYAQTSAEKEAYANLKPPMIYKTVTKEPPRFVATKSPKDIKHTTKSNDDLEEIQKLLNNAQELEKLGVSLPKELTQQLESKFTETDDNKAGLKKPPAKDIPKTHTQQQQPTGIDEYLQRFALTNDANLSTQTEENVVFTPTTASAEEEELSQRTAVFSLTTMKSLTPRPVKTTTESSVELPIFSATKIIEAAIKRAANRIGVSTEGPKGFSRRVDIDVEEPKEDMMVGVEADSDLITDFSEFNYQMAAPDIKPVRYASIEDLQAESSETNYQTALPETKGQQEQPIPDLTANVDELQRLIKNLQELKNLNLSPNDKALLRQADLKYLENLKNQQTDADNTIKSRRQSNKPSDLTTSNAETTTETLSTTTESSRIQLNLSLDDDGDVDTSNDSSTSNTTQSSSSKTTEESRNGSLSDLEDSFGPNPITESPPPPKKKNGFYFLADWNSFLEVGDGDDQVVVRLSPKIGDPRLFLPVKIP